MSTPTQQSAATPSKGAVSTPDKQPTTEHLQSTVTLVVGNQEKAYILHKDLLCFYSDYFRAAFDGPFREAAERKLRLPDVEESVFERVQLWLYTRNLQLPTDETEIFEILIDLWIFGDQHQIPLLQNRVMDEFFDRCEAADSIASYLIEKVYAKTLAGSPLRKAFIEVVAWAMTIEPESGTFICPGQDNYWTKESLVDLVLAINRARLSKTVKFNELPRRHKCFFHVHAKDEHC
ncbi:hypothetical protein QM012_007408 [Aureobasidium pullulans]|uniref:BTB domain-containing protein n=1 Tax=Aureobasidium pullulans TaxID=5580 RepID=A0ABR0TPF2_AURPU